MRNISNTAHRHTHNTSYTQRIIGSLKQQLKMLAPLQHLHKSQPSPSSLRGNYYKAADKNMCRYLQDRRKRGLLKRLIHIMETRPMQGMYNNIAWGLT